jgi:hypothetical protein
MAGERTRGGRLKARHAMLMPPQINATARMMITQRHVFILVSFGPSNALSKPRE